MIPTFSKRCAGVALVTILLVVAIATVLATAMMKQQQFSINRARVQFDQTIVRQYAFGGEVLAKQMLWEDYENAPNVDGLLEPWAHKEIKFELEDEDGEIELRIEDLQGRFNINTLVQNGATGGLAIQRLKALLSNQGLSSEYADRIIDWVDENEEPRPQGAESFEYLGLDEPYRAADQMMSDVTELRLILQLDKEQFTAISPFLTALPDVNTEINVNTASAQVLQAVAPGLALPSAEGIVSVRDSSKSYESVNDFTGDSALGSASRNVKVQGLSVQSRFYEVKVRARYQDRVGYLTSVIQRNPADGTMLVVSRNQSKVILAPVEDDEQPGS